MIQHYINNITQRYKLGNATEHTFRGDLQQLIENLVPEIRATNEPKRQSCGAPDYILTKKDIPVGFIEAKDIADNDLEGAKKNGNKEQFDRYKASLNNLIFTDYLQFHLYRDGQFITKIAIAEVTDSGIIPLPENFAQFENLIKSFCTTIGQTIKNPKQLAQMMAGKARLLADVIEKSLTNDTENNEDSTLKDQMNAFRQILIHDISPKPFADVYAQTIAYGMFAARYHDPTLPTFSRQEAYELIPKSNPFLKKLFGYIAGLDVDDRIKWIVDDLVNIFLACDVCEILKDYGKGTKMEDPIIHFYEDFLCEYDPALRKARGVWYTPQPVVSFIVRAVDEILKTEFGLAQGLADTSKTTIKVDAQGKKINQEVHRVQILDPATGTGTFLAEAIKLIHQNFEGQQGAWSNYVEKDLLPRLNGFELLMASYAMAHLKLDILLSETGFQPTTDQRFRVYLTNSLEEHHPDTGTLFANWLSNEANEANRIKRDTPVMVVMGNPPYSVSSTNKSAWIQGLIADYKKNLNERKINLDDDYIKFIRFGQHFIDKNGSGVLAYISNNSFIDGITHRQMRKSLLGSFDKIYILDLHGNAKKKETCPDGSPDHNVFDIMQGVSINIFVKTGKKKKQELGEVFHFDLQGRRESKFDALRGASLQSVVWNNLPYSEPNYFFVPKNFDDAGEYEKGFAVNEMFQLTSNGIEVGRESVGQTFTKRELVQIDNDIVNLSSGEFTRKYLLKDSRDWVFDFYKKDLLDSSKDTTLLQVKPFDFRFTHFTGVSRGFHTYPAITVNKHVYKLENIVLITTNQAAKGYKHVFISKTLSSRPILDNSGLFGTGRLFPLYVYPEISFNRPNLFNISASERQLLEMNLKYAESQLKTVKEFYQKTVLPFYEKIEKPTENERALFEENKSTYEEAKAAVENLKRQLAQKEQNEPAQSTVIAPDRVPNLNHEIVRQLASNLGLTFTPEKETEENTFAPIDILDYIYAVLHSPSYREKYKEFLKIDFPRVPYPKDATSFWQLVQLGGEIRQIHLLESPSVEKYITQYPEDGTNMVTKPRAVETGHALSLLRVYINDTQYFDKVPEVAWNFYIGGYQPAQKWLKDRKGRQLEYEDIIHYQKIILALAETDRLMKEIDTIAIE